MVVYRLGKVTGKNVGIRIYTSCLHFNFDCRNTDACCYYNIDKFKMLSNEGFNVLHMNIRSFNENFDFIADYLIIRRHRFCF